MKKILFPILIVVLVILVFMIITTETVREEENERIKIVTTIYPYEILVRQLAGEMAEVTSFIPPDASPHTFSPTPDNIKLLESADIVISNGLELETYLEGILRNLGDRHFTAASFLPELQDEVHSEGEIHNVHAHDHHHHHAFNPHIWLDPLFLLRIAEGISISLISFDPDNHSYYQNRYQQLREELLALHEMISEERKDWGALNIINFHDAFYYFNKRYDINRAAVIVHSPGREPTPRELVQIGRTIRDENVRVIFLEPQLNPKAAEIIAAEHNISTAVLDPLGSQIGATTIVELLLLNWERMKPFFESI